ncbi:hypothetical protein RCC89_13815 [Cytophagaceae bacterium ABcell3]|nr:hypothetical protein RCC89_13815 [Cytophagaceae bacterium ABcell3]
MKYWFGLIFYVLFTHHALGQFFADVETGLVTGTRYNEVRVPGNEGTFFDFDDNFESNPQFFYRARVGYTFNDRHVISALFAPLALKYTDGVFADDVRFNNDVFEAGSELAGRYRFNSYRLTYRYNFIVRENFVLGAGITGKIRDAAIRLSGNGTTSEKTDLGFVPLINFYTLWSFYDRFGLLFEGDALVGPQGRAEDVFLGLTYTFNQYLTFKGGYRLLEGGADVDEVYNFTWINYASVGVLVNF